MRRMYLQMIAPQPQGAGMDSAVATEAILQRMSRSKSNIDFLESLTEDM
jgi:transcription termination factor Rho